MNYSKYKIKIGEEVSALSQRERVALCLICCLRLSPLYSKFSKIEGWGNDLLLSQCREAAIRWLSGECVNTSSLTEQLLEVIPDTEDFETIWVSYALNAGDAHKCLLDQIGDNDPSFLVQVLQDCYDTIYFHVHECLDPEYKGSITGSDIESYPAMVSEIDWQLKIFSKVKGNKGLLELIKGLDVRPILDIA